jgi:DNA gyrase subunit B
LPLLIENNYVYIARPPLYRLKRKKEIRFIHSEKEMDERLLHLGMEDLLIRPAGKQNSLDKSEVKSLLRVILHVEFFINSIERKGIPFKEFLSYRNEDGNFPQFLVPIGDENRFIYTDEDLVNLKKEDEQIQKTKFEETLASIPEEERTEEMQTFHIKKLHFIELYDRKTIEKMEKLLNELNISLEKYSIATDALYDVVEEGGLVTTVYTLKEVIDFLRKNGRKGIEIQRYKGLGEMNADQLWDTTMDPTQRTLVRVNIADAIAVDHMFSMLMGEDVAPRRAFIEQHALSAKNLDI